MTHDEQQELINAIAAAIRVRSTDTSLSEDEIAALRLMIKEQELVNERLKQSIAFRNSIIEKSLAALLASVFIGTLAWISAWFIQHVYKP